MSAPAGTAMTPLIIPRRLAIALLAEAQKAAGEPVRGVIGARDGVPVSVRPSSATTAGDETVWAHYRSGTGEPDAQEGRQLLISVDTKGVLQLRCWERDRQAAVERELRIV
jgi:hypothetical protein